MNKSNSFGEKMSQLLKKAGEVSKKVASSFDQLSTSLLNRTSSFNESLNNPALIPNSSSRNENFEGASIIEVNSDVSFLFYSS